MADDLLQKAIRLKQSGKLDPEKAAKLDELIARVSAKREQKPASTTQPEPVSVSQPEATEEPSIGQTMGSMMIAPEETSGMSSSGIISDIDIEKQKEVDRNYDDSLPNLSKKKKLFAPPVIPPGPPDPNNPTIERAPYMYYEPSVEKAMAWAKKNGMTVAYNDMERDGERSRHYQEYADAQWQEAANTFNKHRQGAVRVKFQNAPGVDVPMLQQARGTVQNVTDAMFSGFDNMMTLGAGRNALGAIAERSPAEKELEARGIIESPADRMKNAADKNAIAATANIVSSIGGAVVPGGATNALFTKVAPVAKKAYGTVTGIMTPAFLQGAGEQVVEEYSNFMQDKNEGGVLDSVQRMLDKGLSYAEIGGLLGIGTELVGAIGKGLTGKVHDPLSERGRDLGIMRDMNQGKPVTRFASAKGVAAPEALEEEVGKYQAKRLARNKAAAAGQEIGPPLEHPVDIIANRAVEKLGPASRKRVTQLTNQMETENAKYYASPDGQKRIGLRNVGEEIKEFIESKQTPDGPIPFIKTKEMQDAFNNHLVDWERTALLQKELASQSTSGRRVLNKDWANNELENEFGGKRLADMTPMGRRSFVSGAMEEGMTQAPSNREKYLKALSQDDSVMMIDGKPFALKRLNAQELDEAIAAVDDLAKASRKTAGSVPPGMKNLQRALRDSRDKFGWSDTMGPKPVATIDYEGGKKEISGWSALKHKHSLMKKQQENIMFATGSPGVAQGKYTPEYDMQQQSALANKVRRLGSRESSESGFDKLFHDILKDDPEGLKFLQDATATDAYMRFTGSKPRVAIHGGSPSAWAPASLEWIGLHLDPTFRAMGSLAGRGAAVGTVGAASLGTNAEKRIRDISNLPEETADNVRWMIDKYKTLRDSGTFDDLLEGE